MRISLVTVFLFVIAVTVMDHRTDGIKTDNLQSFYVVSISATLVNLIKGFLTMHTLHCRLTAANCLEL